ncbi:MAG: molybdenum cofactor biosynthesis protein MoaE [Streptococcaceae bacterium]|nr:molybdenum cofactor biosynthesis protein MoaE [Streptococcaceae bacterium]
MAQIELTRAPIDVGALTNKLRNPNFGAIATFVGTIREWTESAGGARAHTDFITYTAYEEMARAELAKLAAPVEAAGCQVIIVHSLATLRPTDIAVFIGVASAHRKEALTACQQLIDGLKETVPIWKKETDEESERWGK